MSKQSCERCIHDEVCVLRSAKAMVERKAAEVYDTTNTCFSIDITCSKYREKQLIDIRPRPPVNRSCSQD